MSLAERVPVPSWVEENQSVLTVDHARLCFYVRLAALFHNKTGSLTALAKDIGVSMPTLHMVLKRGQISADTAVKIEAAIGRDLFPRELFRPDLFSIPQE